MMGIERFSFADTLLNFISGLGTMKDKAIATRFAFIPMTRDQLDAAYRSDWIARKVVDIPASDATREWREWQADTDQIEALEEAERELQIQQKLCRAMIIGRLYGGAAMILGIRDSNPAEELDLESVGEDDLEFVHVVSRWDLNTGPIIWDITSPWYGEPLYYERKTVPTSTLAGVLPAIRIHPSRVVRMIGNELPDIAQSGDGWGDSVLQAVGEAILAAATVNASIASLIHESKIDIIQMPELSARIMNQEYADRLMARFSRANTLKSMTNALVLDKEETWNRQEVNFGGLQPLIRDFLSIAAGAADIPATRLLGESPRGMNATGVSDIRNYYDKIASDQESRLTPAISRLDEVLIRSALGARDPSIFYEWTPLWQLDETQKADLWLKKAQVFQIDVSAGALPIDALAEARANQLIEDGVYPGLEQALEEAAKAAEQAPPEPPGGTLPQLPPGYAPAALPPPPPAGGAPGAPSGSPAPSGPARGTPATGDSDPFHPSEKQARDRKGRWRNAAQLKAIRVAFEEHIGQMRRMMNEHLASLDGAAIAAEIEEEEAPELPTLDQIREIVDRAAAEHAAQPSPPPVVNISAPPAPNVSVHVDAKRGRVVKEIEHDEAGRAKRVIEDDEDDG